MGTALGWAAAITATEGIARRTISSRSGAWLLAYSAVGTAAGATLVARAPSIITKLRARRNELVAGMVLAGIGYPLGRFLLGDRATEPPPEPLWLETLALAGVVAPAEELVWGGIVEPQAGIVATSVLFAAKHVAIDGRWRRSLGLLLFGLGLGLLRRRSRALALAVHVGSNGTAVVLGHALGWDQF